MSFWRDTSKPMIGLSPMDGVTDLAYREIQMKYGEPDVIFTEFIPVEGIVRLSERLLIDFWYTAKQKPVVAQIYGNEPELYYASAQLVCELGFDGIDINMGCPARSVVHRGCGAALIRTPDLAVELIKTTQQAVKDYSEKGGIDWSKWPVLQGKEAERLLKEFIKKSQKLGLYEDLTERQEKNKLTPIPVTVKTRIGFNEPVTETWIPTLIETGAEVVTIHGRTLKQLYSGQADWNEVAKAVSIRDEMGSDALIFGNGDIKSLEDVEEKLELAKFDGFLVGRATYGNPWIFQEIKTGKNSRPKKLEELFEVIKEHTLLHSKYKSEKAFVQMRKNLAWYINGIPDAAKLRVGLVTANSYTEVENILDLYLKDN